MRRNSQNHQKFCLTPATYCLGLRPSRSARHSGGRTRPSLERSSREPEARHRAQACDAQRAPMWRQGLMNSGTPDREHPRRRRLQASNYFTAFWQARHAANAKTREDHVWQLERALEALCSSAKPRRSPRRSGTASTITSAKRASPANRCSPAGTHLSKSNSATGRRTAS